jgi:hypothetical protein
MAHKYGVGPDPAVTEIEARRLLALASANGLLSQQPRIRKLPAPFDRANVIAVAVVQIMRTAPVDQLHQAIADYLRDEFEDIARMARNDIRLTDE